MNIEKIRNCISWCLEQVEINIRYEVEGFDYFESIQELSYWNEDVAERIKYEEEINIKEIEKIKGILKQLDIIIVDYL